MLTDKELQIMKLLWEKGALTCSEIIELSAKSRTWKEKSVFVILKSMMNKGYIEVSDYRPTQTRNAKVYKPTLTREEYAVEQSESFNVNTAEFLIAFVKHKNMEKETTEALLKQLLEKFSSES